MAEHIHFDNKNYFAEWFLIHSITHVGSVPNIPEGGVMVTLTINGVECSVVKTLETLGERYDELVKEAAQKHLKEFASLKLSEIKSLFDSIGEKLKEATEEIARPIGFIIEDLEKVMRTKGIMIEKVNGSTNYIIEGAVVCSYDNPFGILREKVHDDKRSYSVVESMNLIRGHHALSVA